MTRRTDSETIIIRMGRATKDTGSKTSSRGRAKRSGLMVLAIKESIVRVENMALVTSYGRTVPPTQASSARITLTARAFTPGQTGASMTGSGERTRWTAWGCSLGRMAANTKANMWRTKRRVTAFLLGPTSDATMASGRMASSTAKAPITTRRAKLSRASGWQASVLSGSPRIRRRHSNRQNRAQQPM